MSMNFDWDPMGSVLKVIEDWDPDKMKTEKQYEKSLVKELQQKLPKEKIEQQYGSGAQKIDIVISEKVAIELKNHIRNTSDYQRLIGQVTEYLKKWEYLIILVCGEVRDSFKKDFGEFLEGANPSILLFEDTVRVVYKP